MSDTKRIAFQLPHDRNASNEELFSYTFLAEELGYDAVFVPESWYRDAFTTLGFLAARTKTIRLGSGIVNVFSRSPALIAQGIATVDEASGGRAILGLGISGPTVIKNWHGIVYERALKRTQETVEIVKMVLSGHRVDYSGEIFQLNGIKLGFQPLREKIPIFIASMGPKNNELVGAIADGWLPIWLPLKSFGAALDEVGSVMEVAPNIMACVGEDREELRKKVRPHLAYYLGGMGTFYRDFVSRFGFKKDAARVYELWQSGNRRGALSAVSDALIDEVAVIGTPEECRQGLGRFRDAGATLPVIFFPHGATVKEIRLTLESLR